MVVPTICDEICPGRPSRRSDRSFPKHRRRFGNPVHRAATSVVLVPEVAAGHRGSELVRSNARRPVMGLAGVLRNRLDDHLTTGVGSGMTEPASLKSCSFAVQDREEQIGQGHRRRRTPSKQVQKVVQHLVIVILDTVERTKCLEGIQSQLGNRILYFSSEDCLLDYYYILLSAYHNIVFSLQFLEPKITKSWGSPEKNGASFFCSKFWNLLKFRQEFAIIEETIMEKYYEKGHRRIAESQEDHGIKSQAVLRQRLSGRADSAGVC